MKNLFTLLLFLGTIHMAQAQLNMTYVSHFTYTEDLNDIWGYVAPDGTEYALVGLRNGVSILNLSDPANPTEAAYLPGPSSTWRDLKTWGEYAYVTNETSNGVMVIDLTDLPNGATAFDWTPDMPGLGTLSSCHNIYIDEFGYAYLVGCNLNSGGPIIVDCFTTPGSPEFVSAGPDVYQHDTYVRDNIMYGSEIYEGAITFYDVTDKDNITMLASQLTTNEFTHNAWPSDDGTHVFTTDEQANAPVGAYNIEDWDNVYETDLFRPIETLGEGVIPHNVHVWEDWIITSYYTDGCLIMDGSRPNNIIEVANFDTFIPASTGFDGVWGAYPFLPSGLVLATDIGNGCYILEPNYVRACWLEGLVTDALTTAPLNGVNISIDDTEPTQGGSGLDGTYATGKAVPGAFNVTYSLAGYIPQTIEVNFVNGELVILDVQLVPLVSYSVSGQVVRADNGAPIPGAAVYFSSDEYEYTTVANASGDYFLPAVFPDDYTIYAGAWGFVNTSITGSVTEDASFTIELAEGYADDFIVDLGWTSTGAASSGQWERGEPLGTTFQGATSNPDFDVPGDVGDQCYVTGNSGTTAGEDDVDDGVVTLTSPVIDMSNFNTPVLSYQLLFFNEGGNNAPNDELTVKISNGNTEVVVETIDASTNGWNAPSTILVSDFINLTSQMRVIFEASDLPGAGHVVEAAVDAFSIVDSNPSDYPAFTSSGANGCIPLNVTFNDNSDSTTTYNWTFTGGTPETSSDANPTISYLTPGTFDVVLIATTASGNSYTVVKNNFVITEGPPTASFSFNNVSEGLVNFTNNSDDATSYSWEFGDGFTSDEENPSHTYTATGQYDVELIATNDCGSFLFSETINITLPVNVDELEQNWSLTAFPNPFEEKMTINYDLLNSTSNAQLNIINVLGQNVQQIDLAANAATIEVGATLSNGIYFIQIESEEGYSKMIKVIKQGLK